MDTSPAKKLATTLGVGSLLLGTALVATPAATAAPPVTITASAPASTTADSPMATGARTALVTAWYRQFLLRDAAQDPGSSYWVVQLRDRPADAVLAEILSSREYVTTTINSYYAQYLNRSTDRGAQYWIDGVARGDFPFEWVQQNILASPEYLASASAGGRGTDGVIEAWYADVLGRTVASPGELAYWKSQLQQDSPLLVLRQLWYTPEAANGRVAFRYAIHLGRAPGPGEVAYWYGREVVSDIATTIAIASSPEAQAYATANFG